MKYEIIEDAPILIPNKEHRNFTHSKDVFPKGAIIDGEMILIKGLRKGVEFQYRILRTNEGQLIYINKTKPMENVEVTLSANGGATVLKMPNETNMTIIIASATAVGALGGFMFARKKKYETKKQILAVAIGGVLGYIAGRIIEKNKGILIEKR
jgi:hypothetical protein